MKRSTLKVWLCWSIWIIRQLYIKNTLLMICMGWGSLVVTSRGPHGVLLVSYLAGMLSGTVHTGVEVRRIDSEMSRLVKRPWLQLMCCAVCLPCGRNFR